MNLIDIVPLGETDIYLFALKNGVNPFSAKLFFGKKKKKKKGNFLATLVFMLEREIWSRL